MATIPRPLLVRLANEMAADWHGPSPSYAYLRGALRRELGELPRRQLDKLAGLIMSTLTASNDNEKRA